MGDSAEDIKVTTDNADITMPLTWNVVQKYSNKRTLVCGCVHVYINMHIYIYMYTYMLDVHICIHRYTDMYTQI